MLSPKVLVQEYCVQTNDFAFKWFFSFRISSEHEHAATEVNAIILRDDPRGVM